LGALPIGVIDNGLKILNVAVVEFPDRQG